MANGYKGLGIDEAASEQPPKINFKNWFSEAWTLFSTNAALWVPAVAITVYGPGAVLLFLNIALQATKHVGAQVSHPIALIFGVVLFAVIFSTYMLNGLGNLAVRQVSGAQISFPDIFSGSRNFAGTLLWLIIVGGLIGFGTMLVVIPGVIIAALMLPSFALVASGYNLIAAAGMSLKATRELMANRDERASGLGMAFVLGLMLNVGGAIFGLGLLAALPIALLVSALAYRDLIGLPGQNIAPNPLDNVPDTVLDDEHTGPRVSLTGEPLDEQEIV